MSRTDDAAPGADPRPDAAPGSDSGPAAASRAADSRLVDPQIVVAPLTPPGRGAVATLAVTGERVAERVAKLFQSASGRPLESAPPGRVVYGRWQTSGEDVIACRVDERRLEIHCHGGRAASAEIVRSLVAIGAREASWQDWIAREECDPIAAAARIALASADAERAAAVLLDQYHGALRKSVDAIVDHLDRRAAAEALAALERLLALAPLGAHLAAPWTVMLAGRPNVGKSSLLNAILGYERAIVFEAPGTTRDLLRGGVALAGWPFEFWDAAGLRDTPDRVEAAGVAKARQRSARADLVLLVFDAQSPWSPADDELAAALPGALRVMNKCDLVAAGPSDALRVSARTGEGLDALRQAITSRLVPEPPAPGEPVPFTPQQQSDLAAAAELAANGQLAAAAELLRSSPPGKMRWPGANSRFAAIG